MGSVYTLIAADDRLFAVTSQGSIYCFGPSPVGSPPSLSLAITPLPNTQDTWTDAAEQMLLDSGIGTQTGVGLIWGTGSGRLVEELLKQSDYVTVHCPLTPETKDIIAEKELEMMKNSAYLFNTARGGIINEQALVKALDGGQIQGAAFDVTVVEPPDSDHPLVTHDKILLTPHIAANSDEAMSRMAAMAAQEIVRVLSGEKPFNIVNPQIYQ